MRRTSRKSDRDPLLEERETTHGDFAEVARVAQLLKAAMRGAPNWPRLTDAEKEAFEMKATKIARHLCGDPRSAEHLTDDAGYSALVLERLPPAKAPRRRNGR